MNTVAVFLKYPSPGNVKTRMAKDLGQERAAQIYSAMAKMVLSTAGGVGHSLCVFYDPPQMEKETREWLGRDFKGRLLPQRGQSLGEKIPHAIEDCICFGSGKVVVIGTDCVEITPEILKDSFKRLDETDTVIGPCEDGGYYLIGLKRNHKEIFRGVDWSTNKVTAQTLEKILKLPLKVSILDTLRDIDFAEDLDGKTLNRIESANFKT